jgi:hypothetical protein
MAFTLVKHRFQAPIRSRRDRDPDEMKSSTAA